MQEPICEGDSVESNGFGWWETAKVLITVGAAAVFIGALVWLSTIEDDLSQYQPGHRTPTAVSIESTPIDPNVEQ